MRELQRQGALLLPFNESEPIPVGCHIVWDPGMGRNRHPLPAFRNIESPVVITVHGSATFTMKWREVYSGLFEAIRDRRANVAAMREWAWFRNKVAAVIAVSRYGALEASLAYDIRPDLIKPIYHGVDHTIFFREDNPFEQVEPYLLHVSTFQPKKNVERIIDAYQVLPVDTRPILKIVSPGFQTKRQVAGLSVIDRPLTSPELAKLYNAALAFIFPSLHETFGLPIIEAMACGCPVITSFDTACGEIAGDAALLVDPRSVGDIAQAMSRIINEPDLRTKLSQKGLARASQFTWAETARLHMAVFRSVLKMDIETKPTSATCIVVLGMHRSGTSALTGVLSLLGIHAGESLLPATENVNPKGFWEHAEIVSIHDKMLKALGSSWEDESPLPDGWWHSPLVADYRNKIISALRHDFGNLSSWLIKDPRMCRLLPLWKEVFPALACKPLFILALRNPAEVAHSLRKRNDLNEAESCLLWLTHMLEAEYQTRGQPRAFVTYERLLSDWRGAMADIGKTLCLTWPIALEDATPKVDAFLDPSLHHHRGNATLSDHPVCRMAQEGFELLSVPSPDPVKLDCLRERTDEVVKLVAPLSKQVRSLLTTIAHLESEKATLQTEIIRIKNTASWKVTRPLRFVWNALSLVLPHRAPRP